MRKNTIVAAAVAVALVATAPAAGAAVVSGSWDGLFTLYTDTLNGGQVFQNTSYPYYGDPTWGYGLRTQVSGTLSYDTTSGVGTASVSGFDWGNAGSWQIHDFTLQYAGDGAGGIGSLIAGTFLYDWNNNIDLAASIVWDASGFLAAVSGAGGTLISGTGALPASDSLELVSGIILPIGPAPLATSTIDAVFPLVDDGIAGARLTSGPWTGFSVNLDITRIDPAVPVTVPLPAAAWLFGVGLLGLAMTARRKPAR
ncbi:MAG: VPLPA-CTERM sorting domain-containing protein [Pseudomonadota bacterium]